MVRHQTRIRPRLIADTSILVKVLPERSPRDLKLGYLMVLTIMAERKSRTTTGTNFQGPRDLSFSLSWMMSRVREATNPAAEGIGKPRKSLVPPVLGRRPDS